MNEKLVRAQLDKNTTEITKLKLLLSELADRVRYRILFYEHTTHSLYPDSARLAKDGEAHNNANISRKMVDALAKYLDVEFSEQPQMLVAKKVKKSKKA